MVSQIVGGLLGSRHNPFPSFQAAAEKGFTFWERYDESLIVVRRSRMTESGLSFELGYARG